MRPKVLVIVTVATTARLFMRGYVEYLTDKGYDVVMAADELGDFEEEFNVPNLAVRSVPLTRNPSLKRDVTGLIAVYKLVKDVGPDVLIYATPKASLLGSIAGFLAGVPVRLYHLWGIRFETTAGPKRIILKYSEKICAAASTNIIANSRSLADRASELGIADRSRIRVPGKGSSHGVDSDWFSPQADLPPVDSKTAEFLNSSSDFTIGYVGRLHADKGVDTLLEAASEVAKAGVPIRVILVGGDEGVQSEIDSHTFNFPLWRTGQVEDVRPYIRQFDVLVLMSLREGFPNVVLEAAAMSVPAIVSDATGCKDAVSDGETGMIVPVGDIEGLSRALTQLIENPEWRLRLGVRARSRAVEDFNPQDVWARTEAIVEEQLKHL